MTDTDRYYVKMTETPVAKLVVSLGIPTTISMLITNIYNLADTYFVGGLGESPQAATGILFTLQSIIQALAFMLGHGSGTYVSKALADKNVKESSKYASTAFFTGAFFGTLLCVLGLVFLKPFVMLLGSTETILPHAMDYGMWVLIACPFMVCSLVLNNNLRYEGKATYAMIGLTLGGILNIFGDYVLIKLCNMGVYGAGLATAVSQMISFTVLLIMFIRHAQSTLSYKMFSFSGKVHLEIIKGGLPSLIRQGLTSISGGILNNCTKVFGDAAIAAMSVTNRFSMFVMCVGLGIGQGFQPVAAFNYRAKKFKRVKKALVVTMGIGFCLVGAFALVGFIFAENIVYIFQKSADVIKIGTPALRYACVGMLFMSLTVPINMLYQSIRKSGIASFLSMLRSGVALIPTVIIGSQLFGIVGIQTAQPIADALTGVICIPFIVNFLKKDHNK